MGVFGWILFGFVVGLIARAVMPGRDPLGLIGTVVLGMVGALLGGWVGQMLGLYVPGEDAGFVTGSTLSIRMADSSGRSMVGASLAAPGGWPRARNPGGSTRGDSPTE